MRKNTKSVKGGSKPPQLKILLKFKNIDVIQRFSKDYGYSLSHSKLIFKDLLMFLWLSEYIQSLKKKDPITYSALKNFGMFESWLPIDLMWHTFLIFTQDYNYFCNKYFKKFIHHIPEKNDTRKNKNTNSNINLTQLAEIINSAFGRKTLIRWLNYPQNEK